MQALSAVSEAEAPPGQALGATLGLLALFFLPLCGGGYSGAGYQVGLVLLPVAAAIAWATSARRPRMGVAVLLLFSLSVMLLPLWIHPGKLLWYYALHCATAWAAVWVLLREVPGKARWLLPVLTGGPVLTALYGWWHVLAAGDLSQHNVGTFGLHNAYAGFLVVAWPVAAYGALQAQRLAQRVMYGAAALLLAVTLVFTFSRASWLVFALQLAACGGWLLWRRLRGWGEAERMLGWGAGVLALGAVALFSQPFTMRVLASIANPGDYSLQGRLRFWQAALDIFASRPWLGAGLGGFAFTYPQYQQDWRYYSVDPHSWPLQLLCEMGLVGACIALAIVAGVGWWLRRLWRSTSAAPAALLLSCAVLGSLAHAAVDFDYTFGATTALLGAILALGSHLASAPPEPVALASSWRLPVWHRVAIWLTAAALLGAAVAGQGLTFERYMLDRLRDSQRLTSAQQLGLLRQAIRFVPYNFRTRYQLASLLAQPGREQDRPEAKRQLDACLRLNRKYTLAWALKGRLDGPGSGDASLEYALKLDPFNYPEHYFLWASLAQDDDARRERLQLGLKRIPIDDPIPAHHIRPTWYKLNPMMVSWYEELERVAKTEEERQLYRSRKEVFKQFLKNEQANSGASQPAMPEAPESSV